MNQEISVNHSNMDTKKTKLMQLEIPQSKWSTPYVSPIDSARGMLTGRNLEPLKCLPVSELINKVAISPQLLQTQLLKRKSNSSSLSSPPAPKSAGAQGRIKCVCGSSFEKMDDFYDHYSNECVSNLNVCSMCNRGFTRKQDLKYHMASHIEQSVTCDGCGFKFSRQQALNRHKHYCKNTSS